MSDGLVREAVRIYRRYQVEVVEAFDLCPWAARARRDGRVAERVSLDVDPDVGATLAHLDTFAATPEVDVGLILFPRLRIDRPSFERFVATVRDADQTRGRVTMALAAFHPDAAADLADPARLVPFLRRSPDPTIQCVRLAVLDRVRRAATHGSGFVDPASLDVEAWLAAPDAPPLHERVARENHARIAREGAARLESVLAEIRADREAAYAAAAAG